MHNGWQILFMVFRASIRIDDCLIDNTVPICGVKHGWANGTLGWPDSDPIPPSHYLHFTIFQMSLSGKVALITGEMRVVAALQHPGSNISLDHRSFLQVAVQGSVAIWPGLCARAVPLSSLETSTRPLVGKQPTSLTSYVRGKELKLSSLRTTISLTLQFPSQHPRRRRSSAFFCKTDVTKWEDQVHLFKRSLEDVKRIDYVFANAGILESTYLPHTSSEKVEWIKPDVSTIDVNVTGALYTCHLAAQVFRTQPIIDGFRGKALVTASVA